MLQARNKLLKETISLMNLANARFQESLRRVQALIPIEKKVLTADDAQALEALTARFARLNDLITQKVFRTLDQIELSDEGSVIDRINRAEKRGLIESATEWRVTRELRNTIAHDYLIEANSSLIKEVVSKSSVLMDAVSRIDAYVESRGYLE